MSDTMTVPEAIALLDGKGSGEGVSEYLKMEGMKKPNLNDENTPALSVCCPVANWLKNVTGKPVLVGITTIFTFELDPVVAEFPTAKAEFPIPQNIRSFILYLDYFTRNWEMETETETE